MVYAAAAQLYAVRCIVVAIISMAPHPKFVVALVADRTCLMQAMRTRKYT